jgi:hypothetical protein
MSHLINKITKQFSRILILTVFINAVQAWSISVLAQESSEPEKKEGEGAAAPAGGTKSNADREWAQRTSKLNIQDQKIKDATAKLQKLIQAKNSGQKIRDEKNVEVNVLDEITTTYKELKTNVDEYSVGKDELRFRFPEEGVVIERQYVPLRLKSLDEIEREIGIEGTLVRLKNKTDKKYEVFIGVQPENVEPATKVSRSTTIVDKKNKSDIDEKPKKKLKLSK